MTPSVDVYTFELRTANSTQLPNSQGTPPAFPARVISTPIVL